MLYIRNIIENWLLYNRCFRVPFKNWVLYNHCFSVHVPLKIGFYVITVLVQTSMGLRETMTFVLIFFFADLAFAIILLWYYCSSRGFSRAVNCHLRRNSDHVLIHKLSEMQEFFSIFKILLTASSATGPCKRSLEYPNLMVFIHRTK